MEEYRALTGISYPDPHAEGQEKHLSHGDMVPKGDLTADQLRDLVAAKAIESIVSITEIKDYFSPSLGTTLLGRKAVVPVDAVLPKEGE